MGTPQCQPGNELWQHPWRQQCARNETSTSTSSQQSQEAPATSSSRQEILTGIMILLIIEFLLLFCF